MRDAAGRTPGTGQTHRKDLAVPATMSHLPRYEADTVRAAGGGNVVVYVLKCTVWIQAPASTTLVTLGEWLIPPKTQLSRL